MNTEDTIITNTGHVKLEMITPDAQHVMSRAARVSNPSNQENRKTEVKLLKYLAANKHWSPFEMASMCIEIKTTRAISAQIIRHRSFHFQEMSQRYTEALAVVIPDLRRQDLKNRQNSISDISPEIQAGFKQRIDALFQESLSLYHEMLSEGIAKECARAVLPLNTESTIYMHGTIRDWIHYCAVRCDPTTQLEQRQIADAIKRILIQQIPALSELLEQTI